MYIKLLYNNIEASKIREVLLVSCASLIAIRVKCFPSILCLPGRNDRILAFKTRQCFGGYDWYLLTPIRLIQYCYITTVYSQKLRGCALSRSDGLMKFVYTHYCNIILYIENDNIMFRKVDARTIKTKHNNIV